MKNLKFRVWNIESKKFSENHEEMALSRKGELIKVIVYPENHFVSKVDFGYEINLFTGLIDKNKNEIYEGDIIEIIFEEMAGTRALAEIRFNEKTGAFIMVHPKGIPYRDLTFLKKTIEVIGNKYENQELLK
jgi:uncharacterized phage protein (TIGR01671 family)